MSCRMIMNLSYTVIFLLNLDIGANFTFSTGQRYFLAIQHNQAYNAVCVAVNMFHHATIA